VHVRHERIGMPDGVELAVTLYLPEPESRPCPALLEYLPYRKDDAMLVRPAAASARGEARTEIHLADRLLVFTSVLDLDGDEEWLRYRFRRELRRDGALIRARCWDRRFRRDGH
jgi:hypothetical protein